MTRPCYQELQAPNTHDAYIMQQRSWLEAGRVQLRKEGVMGSTGQIGRRALLRSGSTLGAGALAAGALASNATPAAADRAEDRIEWLDYDPPRPFAAGARVGNVVYLAGETAPGTDITEQTERVFANIQRSLRSYGTDLEHVFRMTVYLVNIADQPAFAQVRTRLLPRPIPSTLVEVTRLVPPEGLIEIDALAVVPEG